MTIGILGDLHIGARNGSDYFRSFFEPTLWGILEEYSQRGIKDVWQLGDLFDSRRVVNVKDIAFMYDIVLEWLVDLDITLHVLAGNHDLYSGDHSRISSLRLIHDHPNIRVYYHPEEVETSVGKILVIPWINAANQEVAMHHLKTSNCDFCFGHFEIKGFKMYANSIEAPNGLESSDFKRFKGVFSGHYHHPSTHMNIGYLGTPWHLNWSDVLDTKGFYVFGGKELEFIEQPQTLFTVHEYVEGEEVDFDQFGGKVVKVVCNERTDEKAWNKFKKELGQVETIDYAIIDNVVINTDDATIKEEDLVVDTVGTLKTYVEGIEGVDHMALNTYMADVHDRAQEEV